MSNDPLIIFISCGQYSDEETALGKQVAKLVEDLTPFKAYFAEYQSTLEGLTQNIFTALNNCAGFIAIMHHRGNVTTPDENRIRASIWIEQEIAIAAFLKQTFNRNIQVAAYLESGITLEGIREKLILNPVAFNSSETVLQHLSSILPTWSILIPNISPIQEVDVIVNHQPKQIQEDRIVYDFSVTLLNTGSTTLKEFRVDVKFPSAFVASGFQPSWEEAELRTKSHRFFRVTHEHFIKKVLYANDKFTVAAMDYYLNSENDTPDAKNVELGVRVYSGDVNLLSREIPMSELFRGQYL